MVSSFHRTRSAKLGLAHLMNADGPTTEPSSCSEPFVLEVSNTLGTVYRSVATPGNAWRS